MKIIKIDSCGNCPYSEGVFKEKNIETKQVSDNLYIVTKQEHYMDYYCNEKNDKYCGTGDIPKWCPLDDYKE